MNAYRANRELLVKRGQIDHQVADLTATVAADVPLSAIQQKLSAADQWLPIDGDEHAPVGKLVEINSSGPLRLGYGHWRDLLLGAQFYNGLDELITAGGRTVKNVAGYDLTKLMVGQRGVFGRLATITVRTYKRPAGAVVATFAPQPKLIDRLIPSNCKPQWAILESSALWCGYVGDENALAHYRRTLPDYRPVTVEHRTLEADISHRAGRWKGDFRVAVAPTMVSQFIGASRAPKWVADPAFGIILGSGADPSVIRDVAARLGGSATFEVTDTNSPMKFFDEPPGPRRDLLDRLKKAFDPQNRLAPLPWQTA